MKFFEGARPGMYFQGGRLKQDKKTSVRYWVLTFAITLKSALVHRCEEAIVSNFAQISTAENSCVDLAMNQTVDAASIEFFELEEGGTSLLTLGECSIEGLRMTRVEGLVELWITVEHNNTDKLHAFVKDFAFTRVWAEFRPRQRTLAEAAATETSSSLVDAFDRMAEPVRNGGITSLTISAGGKSVVIDKAAADRIHARAGGPKKK